MGSARYPYRTQRGPWMFFGGDGVWAPLTVPGDFLSCGRDAEEVAQFLPRLRETVRKLAPQPPVPHDIKPSSVPAALADREFVFVRRDSQRPPLKPPYEGPYKVLEHSKKTFVLDYGNRQDSVSIDRLKPAFLEPMTPFEAARRAPRGRPPTPTWRRDPAA